MISIGERLMQVVSMVPPCQKMADIGTDHGYVPAWLLAHKVCQAAIASDIAEGPCSAAQETRQRYQLQDRMEIRQAPGLQGLNPGEVQAVVIAGMGGATIRTILEECPEITNTVETFILQPMNAASLVRKWAVANGYRIAEETLCREQGRYYVIIRLAAGQESTVLSDFEAEIGPCILHNKPPLWQEYLRQKAVYFQKVCTQMESSRTGFHSEKYQLLQSYCRRIEEVVS